MKCYPYIISFLFFLYLNEFVVAQQLDSLEQLNSNYTPTLSNNKNSLATVFYKHNNDVLINNLGPYGSVNYYPTTLHFYHHHFNNRITEATSKALKLKGSQPFTQLNYINASRKEQLFSVKHMQQFGKAMSLVLHLDKISTPGEYANQEVNNTHFNTTFSYKNRKDNYHFQFHTNIIRQNNEENGGLVNIQDFKNQLFNSERSYPVNLTNSTTNLKKNLFQLNQTLDLWNFGNDSLATKKVYWQMKNAYLSKERVFKDNDPLSAIYNAIFLDSLATTDSIHQRRFKNNLAIGLQTAMINANAFLETDHVNYLQNAGIDTSYHNLFMGFNAQLKKKKLTIDFHEKYGVSGYRKNDWINTMALNYSINDKSTFILDLNYYQLEPNLFIRNYHSNHFSWENSNFKKEEITDIKGELILEKWQLVLSSANQWIKKPIFFNQLANAEQSNTIESISTFSIAKNYRISRFHFRSVFKYQLTSNEILFPLPQFIGRQLVYYENEIFKKVLKIQIGFNISYTSNYYGYAYMPALSQFYIQNNRKIGDYPYLDIFINTQLKRAQIFLKYEHFNSSWGNYNFYATSNYPAMLKSFKFGISWNMFG